MINSIRQTTIVGEGGKVEIRSAELKPGSTVDVIVLVEPEQGATEYLLSTEANRQHLMQALKDADDPAKHTYVDVDKL
jgi:antitoxin YefM